MGLQALPGCDAALRHCVPCRMDIVGEAERLDRTVNLGGDVGNVFLRVCQRLADRSALLQ